MNGTFDLTRFSDAELEGLATQLQAQLSSPEVAGVDKTDGADFLTRAGASFKSDPAERLEFVKKRLGAENVAQTTTGDIVWRKPGDKRWRAFDEAGLSLADVADFIGDVPEIAGGAIGATLGGVAGTVAPGPGNVAGAVVGAGAGSAAGNIVKQAISAMLPGEESARPASRVKDVLISGGLGAAGQKVGMMVGRALSPSARAAQPASQYAAEGERLAQAVGGDLTAGQRGGSQSLRVTEDYLRRNPSAASIMSEFEVEKQLKPIKTYLDRTLSRLSATEVDDQALGAAFRGAYDRGARLLTDRVLRQGEQDFEFLKLAVGDVPIFEPQNFLSELRLLAQRFGDPTMPPDMAKYAAKATNLLEHYSAQLAGGRYNAQQMQDLLKTYGKAGYGRSPLTILEGLEKSDQTRIARDLFQALTKDLDLAAQQTTTLPVPAGASVTNVAKLLKNARTNYAQNMAAVDELGLSVIGKKIGKMKGAVEPERIAEWAQKLRPSGLSATLDILETMRPGVRGETARNMVENALVKATEAARVSGTGPAMAPFSANKLLAALPDEETLRAILGPNSPRLTELADLAGYLHRVVERSETSNTLQMNPFMTIGKSLINAPANAPGQLTAIIAPRTMARILTDNEAVKRLRILRQAAGRRTARAQEAAAWLMQRYLPAQTIEAGVTARDQ